MSQTQSDEKLNEKLDKFIDKVAYRIESSLQSNEIINVFQDDFEMLGDEDAAAGGKNSAVNMVPRTFFEQDYCKNRSVTCIKFHPQKQHLVAISLAANLKFDDRCEMSGKSFDSHVLILNFSDQHIITLNYILQTPVEITCIEFHPENKNILMGGCINGQVITWDLASIDHRITPGGKKPTVAKMPDEEEDKTQQTAVKLREVIMSDINRSHRNYVSDMKFIPGSVKVDKRNPNEGLSQHFISVSEDGMASIWDSRVGTYEEMKRLAERKKPMTWIPYLSINVYR